MSETEKIEALKLIKSHGYYQLINGYGKQFEASDLSGEKHYKPDTEFQDIFAQYILDHRLGEILFQAILHVEEYFKNILSYSVSKHFGVNNYYKNDQLNQFPKIESYLAPSFYPVRQPHKILNELHDLSLKENKYPTGWYRKHKNHIPPWILFMNTTLGTINQYYKILPPKIKDEIIIELLPKSFTIRNFRSDEKRKKFFWNGLELMREFRNCIAHGSRMYSFRSRSFALPNSLLRITQTSNLYTNVEYSSGIGRKDLFACMIWIVINSQDLTEATSFIKSLDSFFTIDVSGFPKASQQFWNESHLPANFLTRLSQLAHNIY